MAHFVAKTLHIRPNQILDQWGVAELLVAYGHYANEITQRNFLEWKALKREAQKDIERPEEYAVKFFAPDDLEEEEPDGD